jgi:ketosteroid isomerase-like protein
LAQPTNTPDPQLRQRLVALFKQFDEAYNRNDAAAVGANFTEDAVLVTPYGPIFGRRAIEQWYAELFKGVHLSNLLTPADEDSPHPIGTGGNAMWATGKWSATLQGHGGSEEAQGYWGSAIEGREGEPWTIRMLCFNTAPASTASPSPMPTPGNR